MDAKKVLEALDTYDKRLATCKLHNLDDSVIEVRPERADPTKRYSLFLDSGGDWLTKMNHLAWAVEQCRGFVNAGRMEKAFRWLGFLQGALWFAGKYSIEELANHNKPAGEETNLDHARPSIKDDLLIDRVYEALRHGPEGIGPTDYAFIVDELRMALGK